MSADDVRTSVSEDAVLQLLIGAGLNGEQAAAVLDDELRQSPHELTHHLTREQSSPSPVPQDQRSTQGGTNLSSFESSVMTMMERLSQRLDDLSARVDRSSGASTPTHGHDGSSSASTTDRRLTAEQSSTIYRPTGGRCWADIPAEETLTDYAMPLVWDDELEDPSRPRLQVSESTAKALKMAFGRPMPNQARLQVRKPFPFPDVEATRCPKLDPVAKQLLQKEQKQADSALAKLQTLVVDAVAPLVHIVEEAAKGTLNGKRRRKPLRLPLAFSATPPPTSHGRDVRR